MSWLASKGARVYVPLGHSPDVDLVADVESQLLRVQVKTSTSENTPGRFQVKLATAGGNQSWNRIIKRFSPERFDYLFVLVADGRRWFIPVSAVGGTCSIVIGGPKYSEFEVETADPLPSAKPNPSVTLNCGSLRGSSGDGESGLAVNQVLPAKWVRIPPPPSDPGLQPWGQTKIWGKRRVTLPLAQMNAAGLGLGDRIRVKTSGPGELTLERIGRSEPSETNRAGPLTDEPD